MTRMPFCASAFAAVFFSVAAASAQSPQSKAEAGAEIVERWCVECHATGLTAHAADTAPAFASIVERRSLDYIRGFLANPHRRGLMPPFELSHRQIEDVIAYMETLD